MNLDFTSALFLAERHAHRDLRPWSALTTGRPPALDRRADRDLERRVAQLLGTQDAVLARSALHGLIDAVTALAAGGTAVVDEHAYPIAHWAAATAAVQGVHKMHYRHHDAIHAAAQCRRARRPIVLLTDGWCSSCSRPAPLAALAAVAEQVGAHLIVDDSLAVGVLGRRTDGTPFGSGGGGTLPWTAVARARTVVVASTAKAFGAPLAVIGASRAAVSGMRRDGMTRFHASGPSAADRAALRAVLDVGVAELDRRRAHLSQLTVDLRRRLRGLGLRPVGLAFPLVQAEFRAPIDRLVGSMTRDGIRVLPLESRCRGCTGETIGFALRSDHRRRDLDRLDAAIRAALAARALERRPA